ncbi:ABC transporter permease [Amycolatopsis sp. A1MSW2902]|uniref:ABC transporter permease n=1 Tax=Amycolatopsis TaxID=1813 RepID=UPI000561951B|nr:ABC transporter permease [Amycolatopsis nivea]
MISLFLSSARFQLSVLRRTPDYLLSLVTIPLLAIAMLAIMRQAGRADLAPYAIIGSAMMTVWATALFVSGELIDIERWGGTLEGVLAAPAPYPVLLLGRIAAITVVSFGGLAESSVVGWAVFGSVVTVAHPVLFVLTLVCTAAAMVGTASIMAALFALARSARIFQNSMSYPFYILGGTIVPISFLPDWAQPVARVFFLSWSSDLLRDCLRPEAPHQPVLRLAIVLGLGGAGLVAGTALMKAILNRLRRNGTVGYA